MPSSTKKPRRKRGEEDEEYMEDSDSMEDADCVEDVEEQREWEGR